MLACTSAMARSVTRSAFAQARQLIWVFVALAWLMTRPPSTGGPLAKRIDCSRQSAFVHSSMAITGLAGNSASSCVAKSSTPSSKSRKTGPWR